MSDPKRVEVVAEVLVSAFHDEDPNDPLFDTIANDIVAALDAHDYDRPPKRDAHETWPANSPYEHRL